MSEDFRQNAAGESVNVPDEALRSYLLGRLGEIERSQMDQRLLTEDSLAERMRLTESQLIDEYVSGELDHADQELFTQNFLTTEARRQNVRLSSALQSYAGTTAHSAIRENAAPGWLESIRNFFSLKPTAAWAAAGSFALLVLLLGVAWLVSTRRPSDAPIATQRPAPAISPQATDSPAAVVQAPLAPKPEVKPSPEPAPPIAVASAVLLPGTLRGSGEMARVALPRGERDLVRLSLVLETPGPGPFQAELATAEGQTVTVRNRLAPHRNGQTKVVLEIPARLLQTGDYQVKLSRKTDGQVESIGRYYFRAVPE